MAVAPPNGAHTDSRARGSPPLGSTLSSSAIPVTTRVAYSAVCSPPVRGVASGNRCWIRARKAATDVEAIRVDKGQEVYPNKYRKQEGVQACITNVLVVILSEAKDLLLTGQN